MKKAYICGLGMTNFVKSLEAAQTETNKYLQSFNETVQTSLSTDGVSIVL